MDPAFEKNHCNKKLIVHEKQIASENDNRFQKIANILLFFFSSGVKAGRENF